MSSRSLLIGGALFMLLAVVFGAFGAHALRAVISAQQLQTWQTATEYHFYHALGLIVLGIWMEKRPSSMWVQASALLFIAGLVLFCGSLYLLVLTSTPMLGMITPLGGLCFIAAWACWIVALARSYP